MSSTPAEVTVANTRSTSGNGTAILAAPADNMRYQIVGLMLIVGTPGTDSVTVTLKRGTDAQIAADEATTLAKIPLNSSVPGLAHTADLACGFGEAVCLHLSANVTVHWSVSYYMRDSGRPA